MANANGQEPVILNHHPDGIQVNINDPNKPRNKPKFTERKPPKETAGQKIKHAFFGPDVDDVGKYMLKECLEPIGKRMVNNASQSILKRIGDAIQILLFGKVVSNQNGGVDYTSFYNPAIGSNGISPSGQPMKVYKVMDAVDTFTFANRADAEETLLYLRGRIKAFGSSSVIDYYEHINAPVDYMMADRGWVDLTNARVIPTPNGYELDLPKPILLKRG